MPPRKVTAFKMSVVLAMYAAGAGTVWVGSEFGDSTITYSEEDELELTAQCTNRAVCLEWLRRADDAGFRSEFGALQSQPELWHPDYWPPQP